MTTKDVEPADLFAVLGVLVVIVVLVVGLLKADADAVCRSRAMDSRNVTLCTQGSHATTLLGEIECECNDRIK